MERKNNIGENAKAIRESIGFTQKLIADFLACDQSFISKFEAGERNIQTEDLEKMSTLYGCTTQDICAGNCSRNFNMAFRANEYSSADLNVIHDINRIAINTRIIAHLLEE